MVPLGAGSTVTATRHDAMNEAKNSGALAQISSWVWALLGGFVSPLILIVLGELLGKPGSAFSPGETFAFAVYALVVAVSCFLICRKNPRSGWYVPFICNAAGIFAACIEPTFWTTPLWAGFAGVWALAALATIWGVRSGCRCVPDGGATPPADEDPRHRLRDV